LAFVVAAEEAFTFVVATEEAFTFVVELVFEACSYTTKS